MKQEMSYNGLQDKIKKSKQLEATKKMAQDTKFEA